MLKCRHFELNFYKHIVKGYYSILNELKIKTNKCIKNIISSKLTYSLFLSRVYNI